MALLFAAPAAATTPTITEFSNHLTSDDFPSGIAAGSDGNLWFADSNTGGAIGRITTAGDIKKTSAGLGTGSAPSDIAAGADGGLWFADSGATKAIGRIDTTGKIDEFKAGLNPSAVLGAITPGPDGNVWFTDSNSAAPALGRVSPHGDIHEFPLPAGSSPQGIASGADGNLWFTDIGTPEAIGRMTTSGDVHKFTAGLKVGSAPAHMAAGPDGNVWFVDEGTHAIGRATMAGQISEFTAGLKVGANPVGITAGPDGALWFTDPGGPVTAIGRALVSGAITEYSAGLNAGSIPSGIGFGPDGNVWFTDTSNTKPAIGRITTPPSATTVSATATGSTTAAILGLIDGHAQPTTFHVEYGMPGGSLTSTAGQSLGTTVGPTRGSAALSKLRPNTTYQARVVGANPTDTTPGHFVTFKTGPPADRITRMRLRPKTLIAAAHGGPLRGARAVGALITYTGTQPATTTFTVERATLGRRAGKNCVKRNRRNRGHRTCTLYVKVGSFKHKDAAGRVRFRFTGRLHHRKLHVGDYRLSAEPHGAGGIGRVVRKHFGVKAAPRKKQRKG